MPLPVKDRLLLGGFIALAIGSIAIKVAAGPPRDGYREARSGELEKQLQGVLRSQGFATTTQARMWSSTIVHATRGECRITARDARGGRPFEAIFARDAAKVGPLRYLYAGRTYESAPGVAFRWSRIKAELGSRLGLREHPYVPIALASSPACGPGNFRLDKVRIWV